MQDELIYAKRNATSISRFKKERHLLTLTEDQFRDTVLRPLLLRKGLTDGRDLCGPLEEGKDCIFVGSDQLRPKVIYAIQTKKGNINLTSKVSESLEAAITQVKTAIITPVYFASTKEKSYPHVVVLCASGKINDGARRHIVEEVKDSRLIFLDATDLIPDIDNLFPEYWYGIDADKFPYYRKLREQLENQNDYVTIDIDSSSSKFCPISDENFIPLHLYRMISEMKISKGKRLTLPKPEEFPVQGLLSKPDRLNLVLGDAGSGKSTALRRLAYTIVNQALANDKVTSIPILLRATDIALSTERIIDIAASVTSKIVEYKGECFSTTDLANGKVVLLIDALDEVSTEERRCDVIKRLVEFHTDYKKCLIVLTARKHAYLKEDPDFLQFTNYEISPFSYKEAEKMVNQMVKLKSLPSENVNETLRRLKEVHGIELNPLLVTIFIAISDINKKDIPANVTELFKKYTELMLGRWDLTKGFSQQYQFPLKDHLLQKLALKMHENKTISMPIDECKSMVVQFLSETGHEADIDILFGEIQFRSGLLRMVDGQLEFRHLLIQDFFAGRAIESMDKLKFVVGERWWSHAIVFYFGNRPAAHSEMANLIQSCDSFSSSEMKYHAAVSIGQALQACYMAKVADKLVTLEWVINTLAKVKNDMVKGLELESGSSFLLFLPYHIFARNSVCLAQIDQLMDTLESRTYTDTETKDGVLFWAIVGLINAGHLDVATAYIKKFKPTDLRLLLALFMDLFYVSKLRITTDKQKQQADSMIGIMKPRLIGIMEQFQHELKTLLFEERNRKVKAIRHDAGSNEASDA